MKKEENHMSIVKPSDYEECGYCGFDHEYEALEADQWHAEHPGEGMMR